MNSFQLNRFPESTLILISLCDLVWMLVWNKKMKLFGHNVRNQNRTKNCAGFMRYMYGNIYPCALSQQSWGIVCRVCWSGTSSTKTKLCPCTPGSAPRNRTKAWLSPVGKRTLRTYRTCFDKYRWDTHLKYEHRWKINVRAMLMVFWVFKFGFPALVLCSVLLKEK